MGREMHFSVSVKIFIMYFKTTIKIHEDDYHTEIYTIHNIKLMNKHTHTVIHIKIK